MFTDDAVTPVRLEILVDLLRASPQGLTREDTYRLLQPEPLDPDPKFTPAKATLRAGLELLLVEEKSGRVFLSQSCRRLPDARMAILAAFDKLVLASTEVEKYFALFYAYFLGLSKQVYAMSNLSREQWANHFNRDVFDNVPQPNRFNEPKHKGLEAWFAYVGLGWFDPQESFQANPYDRIVRSLPTAFGRNRKLDADDFMARLGAACPELDGGAIFQQANRSWQSSEKKCTLGLSHALIELHLDQLIRLSCPADSSGWSVADAEPPRDDDFRSDRFAAVEFVSKP
jgi:hypothetical protein